MRTAVIDMHLVVTVLHPHPSASHGLLQIHGAHGYLLEEFIKTSTNKRTDKYGVYMLCDGAAQRW